MIHANEPQPEPSKSKAASAAVPLNVADLAWAAGFLDGEGCIHIVKQRYKNRRSVGYRLGVNVAQNDRPALEALCSAVGIKSPIYATKRAPNHSRQCYTVNFSGRSAWLLLSTVMPYLRRKTHEASAALEFWVKGRMGIPATGKPVDPELTAIRESYYLLLRQLK